ncbi:hypothetical protein P154DRAFT_444986, partial [Amniculicola lignicola CBS 123094]
RPLEINIINHYIRRCSRRTIAIEIEPRRIGDRKKYKDIEDYIIMLSYVNSNLQLELAFYRECFKYTIYFREAISKASQDLLHKCIISLVNKPNFKKVK